MQFSPTREQGLARLANFLPRAGRAYANNRNHDDGAPEGQFRDNVSQLSPWLHAGILSEVEVVDAVLGQHRPKASEKFIAEVFWRVYFKGYLEQRPTVWRAFCDERDAALAAIENNSGLRTAYNEAVEGRTGIAAFDHWARELVETGYLHNHARMWFASIWIFTLKLDWQLGADFFLRHLIDGDAASNTLSWRWVGGLHTKGKTYLARPDNIARYTANHPQGPLGAQGLAGDAPALEEPVEHGRQKLDLPGAPAPDAFEQPYALVLHDEAASHVPLDLPSPPALVIGAARPEARSALETGALASEFARDAVRNGVAEAASAFGCSAHDWASGDNLSDILAQAGIERVALPYLPVGWTRDALMTELGAIIDSGRATVLLDDLNRATWPHARAGFFGVKKKIDGILGELGINGSADDIQGELALG
ncbi:MAG: FAD-binding domain-containing protein [Pseudomonadota bacterium]